MHHDPAKNVLFQRASIEEISKRLNLPVDRVRQILQTAKEKMYAARLKRPTPYVDKTVYVSWNALCISAYLQAARALELDDAKHFALRSLDRILSEAWNQASGLKHVIAYSDPAATHRENTGFLDDYAFTAIACLDAYESTSDMTYFRRAEEITQQMIERFYDDSAGGFFDSQPGQSSLGVLGTPRKAFQDSPMPAGNPMAAIALIRMHGYTGNGGYLEKAQKTLELLAGVAGQYGIFAATYGIAAIMLANPHEQIVVIGEDETAADLYRFARKAPKFEKAVLKLTFSQAAAQNLPPVLAATLPNLPAIKEGKSCAAVCANGVCLPPALSPNELDGLVSPGL